MLETFFEFFIHLVKWAAALVITLILSAYLFLAIMMKLTYRRRRRETAAQKAVSGTSNEPHQIEFVDNGLYSLAKRLELIRSAKKSIDLEFFIYKVDHSSRLITQALAEKASQGVKVRILMDFSFAAFRGRPEFARYLRTKGVEIRYYNTSAIYRLFAVQHRSHRKLLIVDDEVAVTGGRNIADDYFDLSKRFNFIDSDVIIQGPLVAGIAKSFDLYWRAPLSKTPSELLVAEDGRRHLRRNLFRATAMDRQLAEELLQWTKTEPGRKFTCTNVEFVTDYPGFGRQYRQVYEKIENLFSEAQRELLIETPYFIIMDEGQKILTDIEKRGTDVVVLTNGLHSTDAYYTVAALYPDLPDLSRTGIEIKIYDGSPPSQSEPPPPVKELLAKKKVAKRWGIHAKRAIIDDEVAVVGTYNIDPRSANLNSEFVLILRDCPDIAAFLKQNYQSRCAHAETIIRDGKLIDKSPIFRRSSFKQRMYFYLSAPIASLFDFLL